MIDSRHTTLIVGHLALSIVQNIERPFELRNPTRVAIEMLTHRLEGLLVAHAANALADELRLKRERDCLNYDIPRAIPRKD